jgi:hypothetical protein
MERIAVTAGGAESFSHMPLAPMRSMPVAEHKCGEERGWDQQHQLQR